MCNGNYRLNKKIYIKIMEIEAHITSDKLAVKTNTFNSDEKGVIICTRKIKLGINFCRRGQ